MTVCDLDHIVLLGDSITQGGWEPHGFGQRLAAVYARRLDVINRGLSGYNTRWIIPVFEQTKGNEGEHDHPKIRLLTIWFGANDAVFPQFVQHVPLDEYAANLRTLINMVRSPDSAWYEPHTKIVLITPPPVNVPQWSTRPDVEPGTPIDRDLAVTEKYAESVREVGKSEGVVVCDVFAPLWEAAGKKEEGLAKFMYDGLHLNADGYTIVYEALIKTIKDNMPELHYENLQPAFAPWDEVDPANLDKSLVKRKLF
ncbi:SGNH hydrolase [Schizopora paradoxa]|uniref:SGNH hydrolase n=1 Tax=Schizopora paradoxa TaxID=27342 RepID=A0A0H2S413_9AGAM|nr:SGNH hydrolase [Schizopora paradoxa]